MSEAKGNSPPGDKPEKDDVSELMKKLSIGPKDEDSKSKQRLESLDLEGIVKFIKAGEAKKIITMAGAGISTAAGIPDFRSPNTGLYDNLKEYNLPDPMAIFSIDYFREQPEPFFKVAKTFYPESYKPTLTHYMLRLLNDKGLLLRHYTQNIDMLEEKAGLPAEKIVYAHGNFRTSHCTECNKEYSLEWMRDFVLADKLPKCEASECTGVVKPDIVFFGENLPADFIEKVPVDFKEADLLIIIGTSLVVMPFAGLVDRVRAEVPRLYINREMTKGNDNWMLALLGMSVGLRCGEENNYRDVFAQGDCDDVCLKLADQMGFKTELEKLFQENSASPKSSPTTSAGAEAKK